MPPRRAVPPGSSVWMSLSCRDTSLAVAPRAAMRSGSRSTRISRATPPTRRMLPTPGTALISRATVRSTNHDNSVSLRVLLSTPKVTTGSPAIVRREITGSLASFGRVVRTRVIASRTSSTACDRLVPNWNSTNVVDEPSDTCEVMCCTPTTLETASSSLRVISVSICAGGAPE
jgi:hypothetical protein